jgi:hypothetical protein
MLSTSDWFLVCDPVGLAESSNRSDGVLMSDIIDVPKRPIPEDYGLTEELLKGERTLANEIKQMEASEADWMGLSGCFGYFLTMGACAVGGYSMKSFDSVFISLLSMAVCSFVAVLIVSFSSRREYAWQIGNKKRKLNELRVENPRLVEFRSAEIRYQRTIEGLELSRREYWTRMSGHQFEVAFGKLMLRLGYDVRVTPASGDGGVDLVLKRDGATTIVQCKAWGNQVPPAPVRELQGVREPGQEAWLSA